MSFHAYGRPGNYLLPSCAPRSFMFFDSDLTSGNVHILLDYQGGPILSTFSAADGTKLSLFPLDRGINVQGGKATYDVSTHPSWEIQNNKLRWTGSGAASILHKAVVGSDIDISVDVSAATSGGFLLRQGVGANWLQVNLAFPQARVSVLEVIGGGGHIAFTGTTPLVANTTYTLRVTCIGSTITIYLNGSLEGSFTSTASQMGTLHFLYTGGDTAATFDNWAYAKVNQPAASTYTVRNYDGDIVTTGAVTTDFIDIPDSVLKQRDNKGPYGWYRVYFTGPTHGSPWNAAYGDCNFVRLPNTVLPVNQPASLKNFGGGGGGERSDEVGRAIWGMATSRFVARPDTTTSAAIIADLLPIVQRAKQWQTDTASPVRPRQLLVAMPGPAAGQTLTRITEVVTALKDYVKVWECRNEPNFSVDAPPWVAGELTDFHNAVKAGDPNGIVLGPGNVALTDYFASGGSGIEYVRAFLNAGGGNVVEAFSIHPYNSYQGDVAAMRYTLGNLVAAIAGAGKSAYDIWMTEQGHAWMFAGICTPRYAARWNALMYFGQEVITHGKMRPETTAYWYDGFDHGYTSVYFPFPTNWHTLTGPAPQMCPVRTMVVECYGKLFTSELDFGTYGQYMYLGGVWTDPSTGDKVIGLQAGSYGANTIRLKTTGASNFTMVDPWGNTSVLASTAGNLTFPVSELPQWLRVPNGTSAALEPTDWAWGTNACLGGLTATTCQNYIGLDHINDDIHQNTFTHGGGEGSTVYEGFQAIDETFPQTVQVTFANQAINRIVIWCNAPWHYYGTPVDFDLQTWDGSTWTTRKTWTQDMTRTFPFVSGEAKAVIETYWQEQCIFDHIFPAPVTCQGVRCLVRDVSFGGYDTKTTSDTANNGQGGWGKFLQIREIQAFNLSGVPPPGPTGPPPRVRNPVMGGAVTS